MKLAITAICSLAIAAPCFSQSTFSVTGTPIPAALLEQNYGTLPKHIVAYDLNICNASASKQSVVSGEIYQALSNANGALKPVGREIILAAIVQNQNHTTASFLRLALNSAITVLSALSSSNRHLPSGLLTATALASMSGQQILTDLKPAIPGDQMQAFENQVLEAALVLDAGSCVERTVFAVNSNAKVQVQTLNFHVR